MIEINYLAIGQIQSHFRLHHFSKINFPKIRFSNIVKYVWSPKQSHH